MYDVDDTGGHRDHTAEEKKTIILKHRLIEIGEFNVGDVVTVSEYCYENKHGGTSITKKQMRCRITKKWNDPECGWRYWATPIDKDGKELRIGQCKTIYIGQFEIIDVEVI